MPADKTLEVRTGSLGATSMRYHELWLQRWLYSRFVVREGYPVPVVFAAPMDAFSQFTNLWAEESNPFDYLLALKDESGAPLYEPHPSPVRYPLISVMRKGVKPRAYQNFSIHRWQHINWPTVSDEGGVVNGKEQTGTDLVKCDLGNVTTSRMPMAFDYRFQIDHYCMRPDTQAFYLDSLLKQFWRGGGAVSQSWMDIEYPGWGTQYVRIYVEGEFDQMAPDEAELQTKQVEFRTSYTLVIEGFMLDLAYEIKPALWKLIATSATPDELDALLLRALTTDLRPTGYNQVLENRPVIPSSGTCQVEGLRRAYTDAGTSHLYLGDPSLNPSYGDNVITPNHDPATYPPGALHVQPGWSLGIPSTTVFGTGTFSGTN